MHLVSAEGLEFCLCPMPLSVICWGGQPIGSNAHGAVKEQRDLAVLSQVLSLHVSLCPDGTGCGKSAALWFVSFLFNFAASVRQILGWKWLSCASRSYGQQQFSRRVFVAYIPECRVAGAAKRSGSDVVICPVIFRLKTFRIIIPLIQEADMKSTRLLDEQIDQVEKEADRLPKVEIAKRHGVSEPSIYS